jgi:predicted O-methyltransferase YrrM
LKAAIKRWLAYRPHSETDSVRRLIAAQIADSSLPTCPPWEGDLIAESLRDIGALSCLEIGFHTGSSALYMLHEVAPRGGRVTSIEPNLAGTTGRGLIAASGFAAAHDIIEGPSQAVLPELWRQKRSFDFVFVDGWKSFDAMAVDIYFIARLLRVGGMAIFDDYQMPSVRKAVRLLETHYLFGRRSIPTRTSRPLRQRIYLAILGRSPYPPFARLQKTVSVEAAPVADWHFYRRF